MSWLTWKFPFCPNNFAMLIPTSFATSFISIFIKRNYNQCKSVLYNFAVGHITRRNWQQCTSCCWSGWWCKQCGPTGFAWFTTFYYEKLLKIQMKWNTSGIIRTLWLLNIQVTMTDFSGRSGTIWSHLLVFCW